MNRTGIIKAIIMKSTLASVLSLALYSAAAATYSTVPGNHTSFKIDWGSCGDGTAPNTDCGRIQVPLDWDHLSGRQISLGMMRVRTASNATRVGSLIFNPGGPGGVATKYCGYLSQGFPVFSSTTAAHFDIICPDPRGIGTSNPISCDPELWNQRQTLFPEDPTSFENMVDHYRAIGQSCLDLSGDIVKYVDTVSVAKDVEAIRIALGEGKLNWLGISYGTMIGAQYAELFPENIRVMALDGNDDHSAPEIYMTTGESESYEDELNRFFDWCAGNETCPLHGRDVAQIFDDLVERSNTNPIPAPGCLPTADTAVAGTCFPNVTGEDIRFNAQGKSLLTYKYDIPIAIGWERLGQALDEALSGNATLFSSEMASDVNSTVWQGLAVGCLDWNHGTTTFEENLHRRRLANATAPHTQGASQSYQYNTQCIGWPVPVKNHEHALDQTAMRLAPPILMVNAEHDPESSYLWAQSLRTQIPSAVFVTRRGDGHGSYVLGGQATALIEAYLVNATLPDDGTVVAS